METRPAPSRLRPDELAEAPEARTETDRDADVPDRARDSRPETDRLDVEERDDDRDEARDEARELELLPRLPLLLRPPPAIPVAGEPTEPLGDTTGASPQVSQYSSPPPMSS
ncbi:hypothetical protein [Streptomyces beijiangensis]|uniref:hypothetical protein n=1 Tax=Streptomyces beijiangensis TaxID=163361 RepID=UPI00336FFE8E